MFVLVGIPNLNPRFAHRTLLLRTTQRICHPIEYTPERSQREPRVRAVPAAAQYAYGLYLEPVQYGCGLYLEPVQ